MSATVRDHLHEAGAPAWEMPLFLEVDVDQPDDRFARLQVFGTRGRYQRELLQVFTLTLDRIRLVVDRER